MSHRDRKVLSRSRTHAQDLDVVLKWLLSGIDLRAIGFRGDCRWSATGLITAALLWVWSEEAGLLERFATALKLARLLMPEDAPESCAYQSFMKLLVRWTQPLMSALKSTLRARMQTAMKSRFHLFGFAIFGADGSRLAVARTVSNEARFSPKKSRTKHKKGKPRSKKRGQRSPAGRPRSVAAQAARAKQKKADSPQLWITTLWHAGTGLPWDWLCGASDSSERHHLRTMIASLPPNALVACDANFVGYEFWAELLAGKREFVIRVGSNVRLLKKLAYVRESGDTVYVWPRREFEKNQPPLVLRLVVIPGNRHPWYLLTSVRNSTRLSAAQIATIYQKRWGIELYYRHFKQTFHRHKLRSHKAEHVECEVHWSMLGLWAMLLYAERHQHRRRIPPERLSVAGMLRAYRTSIRERKNCPEPGESLPELLDLALIDTYVRQNKTSRGYPRKKYESPPGAPVIREATPDQVAHAKRLQQSNKKGVTA